MTTTSDLKLVSKIKVGTSAEYAVVSIRSSSKMVAAANQTRHSYQELRWDLECLAEIGSPTSITGLNETLKAELAKIGELVTLTEVGASRTLPAQGVGGSLTGFPTVEIVDIPAKSFAQYQAFTLTAMTRIPIVDGDGIVEHTTENETTTLSDGKVETSVRGEVRLADDQDAAAWVNTTLIGPARVTATAAGNALQSRVTVTDDSSHAKYSYSTKPGVSGEAGIIQASVEDRTVKDISGRRVRTVSGSATGVNAATFATAQRVAPAANLKIIREDGPSLPNVPDGRVSFNYQYVAGITVAVFPGIFVTRFKETIAQSGGGLQINASSYFGTDPTLRTGLKAPVVYNQRSEIEFIGDFDDHGIDPLLSTDNLIGEPRETRTASGSLKTVTKDYTYLFPTAIDPFPTPRSVDGLA